MQTRSSDNSVCLSVRLSVKRVICDKTKVVPAFLYRMKGHLWQEECLVGGDLFYLKFLVNRPPLEWDRLFRTDICL